MEITQTTKDELLFEIEQLSNPYLYELRNYIRFLKFKQSKKTILSSNRRMLEPEQDPILHGIGMIEVTPFSDVIDDTLYGSI